MSKNGWRTQWHRIVKYYPSARRPFLRRGGQPIKVATIEKMLYSLKDSIFASARKIEALGLSSRVFLGKQLFTQMLEKVPQYLYDNEIHPQLFNIALLHIVKHADRVIEARLLKLCRDNLAVEHKGKHISISNDIGWEFELFSQKSESEQLDILQRIGVITLKPALLPIEPPTRVVPKFKLGEKLIGLIKLTRLPSDFFDFERFSFDTAGLTENEIKRAVEIFLQPENLELAASNARIMREMGGTELSVKFHQTEDGISVEFKAKGSSPFIDSASITLIPRPKQGTLCT